MRLLPYAGLFGLQSRSADVVAGIISHYLGIRCSIEEFVPREIDIPGPRNGASAAGCRHWARISCWARPCRM